MSENTTVTSQRRNLFDPDWFLLITWYHPCSLIGYALYYLILLQTIFQDLTEVKKKTQHFKTGLPRCVLAFCRENPANNVSTSLDFTAPFDNMWSLKVILWSKFCFHFSLQLLKVEVINTYHAKLYIEIPTGGPVILNAKFSFALTPFPIQKMAENHIESWI